MVATGAIVCRGRASNACWLNWPKATALYEERFGFTYIVCATGKSAEEMLAILKRRLASDRDASCARQPSSNGRSCRFVWESGWQE